MIEIIETNIFRETSFQHVLTFSYLVVEFLLPFMMGQALNHHCDIDGWSTYPVPQPVPLRNKGFIRPY